MREWLPTPVLLPGESYGQRSPVAYSPCGSRESDTAELLTLWQERVARYAIIWQYLPQPLGWEAKGIRESFPGEMKSKLRSENGDGSISQCYPTGQWRKSTVEEETACAKTQRKPGECDPLRAVQAVYPSWNTHMECETTLPGHCRNHRGRPSLARLDSGVVF